MLKYILLGYLWYKPATGYDLKLAIDNSTGYFWHAYHSQIYTTLRKLEEEGLINSEIVSRDDHLTRRVYTITDCGKKAVGAWLDEPLVEISKIKEDLLVRLFFSGNREIPEILAELRLQRKLHEQQLADYRIISFPINGNQSNLAVSNLKLGQTLQSATLKFGIIYEEMYLSWLDELICELENRN
jgi:PadR family transcriptional regulator AphA